MEKIRTFIAIELNSAIKDELAQLQENLKDSAADVKWVKPQNIHLTLKFLGYVEEEKIHKISSLLDYIASSYNSLEFSLFKVGCFPKIEYPKVVWVGIDKGCAVIEEIAKKLEEELQSLGFAKEKRSFSAHLTLGRVRSGKNRNTLVEKIKALEFNSSAQSLLHELVLFKSSLTPQGSIYTKLHTSKFR